MPVEIQGCIASYAKLRDSEMTSASSKLLRGIIYRQISDSGQGAIVVTPPPDMRIFLISDDRQLGYSSQELRWYWVRAALSKRAMYVHMLMEFTRGN